MLIDININIFSVILRLLSSMQQRSCIFQNKSPGVLFTIKSIMSWLILVLWLDNKHYGWLMVRWLDNKHYLTFNSI